MKQTFKQLITFIGIPNRSSRDYHLLIGTIFTLVYLLIGTMAFAQAPQKISFQAVIRNPSNVLITSTTVGMKISVLQGSPVGTPVYVETQNPTTNINGLASIQIGTGTVVTGTFAGIDWAAGPYYVKTETDPLGGISYTITGTNQLQSVPYALLAAKANIPDGATNGDMLYWNGTAWVILPIDAVGKVLKIDPSGIPTWVTPVTSALPPVVTTDNTSAILAQSATVQGTAVNGNGELIISRGVCYNTSPTPTVANSIVQSGAGVGVFSSNLSGLTANTLYYVRAFATSIAGTSYGTQLTFTTQDGIATLTTTAASSINPCDAIAGGTIIGENGSAVTARGICYNTSPGPTTANSLSFSYSSPTFSVLLNPLIANTVYYYRAYAINGVGTYYGNELSFTTATGTATLTTAAATSIGACTAKVDYLVTNNGGAVLTNSGLVYATTTNPTLSNSVMNYYPYGPNYQNIDGSFPGYGSALSISGLTPSTTYYVRSFATNCAGTTYGPQVSFTTLNGVISLTSGVYSQQHPCDNYYYSGTTIISNNGGPIAAQGVCYNTSPNPTIANNLALGYNNSFSTIPNTTYYYRAYATNCNGVTYYGNEINYTSPIGITSMTTAAATSVTAGTATLNGDINLNYSGTYYKAGFCWSTSPTPTIADNTYELTYVMDNTQSISTAINGLVAGTTYYYRSYGKGYYSSSLCVPLTYGPVMSFTTPVGPKVIGQDFGGGIIVYLSSPTSGLIAAKTDQGFAEWGCESTTIAGANGVVNGTGQANTTAIVAGCGTAGIAAKICDNLTLNTFSDWYLPSEDEAILIGGAGYFPATNIWTSTQISSTQARYVNGITPSNSNKSFNNFKVRAVRSF